MKERVAGEDMEGEREKGKEGRGWRREEGCKGWKTGGKSKKWEREREEEKR